MWSLNSADLSCQDKTASVALTKNDIFTVSHKHIIVERLENAWQKMKNKNPLILLHFNITFLTF